MSLFGKGGFIQKSINNYVGNDYRKIYFNRYPENKQNCKICGKTIERDKGEITIDHIIPQNAGGTNDIFNLQPLCQSCNSRKKDKINMLTAKYKGDALIREIKREFSK